MLKLIICLKPLNFAVVVVGCGGVVGEMCVIGGSGAFVVVVVVVMRREVVLVVVVVVVLVEGRGGVVEVLVVVVVAVVVVVLVVLVVEVEDFILQNDCETTLKTGPIRCIRFVYLIIYFLLQFS